MLAYDALGLLIEMYLSASYDGFGSPATVGDQVPGVPSVVKSGSGGIEVKNWRAYRKMQKLEREIQKLNQRFTAELFSLGEQTFSHVCETCGEFFVGAQDAKWCHNCIEERVGESAAEEVQELPEHDNPEGAEEQVLQEVQTTGGEAAPGEEVREEQDARKDVPVLQLHFHRRSRRKVLPEVPGGHPPGEDHRGDKPLA